MRGWSRWRFVRLRHQARHRRSTRVVRRRMSAGCVASLSSVASVVTSLARGLTSGTCASDPPSSLLCARWAAGRRAHTPSPPTPLEVSFQPAIRRAFVYGSRVHLHRLRSKCRARSARALRPLPSCFGEGASRKAWRPNWSHDSGEARAPGVHHIVCVAQVPQAGLGTRRTPVHALRCWQAPHRPPHHPCEN